MSRYLNFRTLIITSIVEWTNSAAMDGQLPLPKRSSSDERKISPYKKVGQL